MLATTSNAPMSRPRSLATAVTVLASRYRFVSSLACLLTGHEWRIDMSPYRSVDSMCCVRCARRKAY
ncbi:MAG: hypothetical protein GY715_05045 [Planctomycetes bacterium]|nr:hypothetical protein [Planctomycetota bacterium]